MRCQDSHCQTEITWFRATVLRQPGFYLESSWYCSTGCLEKGVTQLLEKRSQPREKSFQNLLRLKLGHILMEAGVITKEQLDQAIAEQHRAQEEKLGHHLIALDFVKERDITMALSRQFSLPVITLKSQKISPGVVNMVPFEIVKNSKFFPLEYDALNNRLVLVTYDPSDISTMINLRSMINCEVAIYLGDGSVVREMIDQYCTSSAAARELDLTLPLPQAHNLSELARLIVKRAQHVNARSLQIRFFNQLVWARFVVDRKSHDLVLSAA